MKKLLLVCIAGLLCLLALVGGGYQKLSKTIEVPNPVLFEVVAGDTLTAVTKRLHRQDLVQNPQLLTIYARLFGKTNIKRGEYSFSKAVSDKQVLELMLAGSVVSRSVTFIEGMTFKEAVETLKLKSELIHVLTDKPLTEIASEINIGDRFYEGLLFPDTYQYTKGMTDLSVLKIAYKAMQRILEEEWQARGDNLPYKTAYEALIMASIVEKETGAVFERAQIAGVFVRRLQKNMRLQTDPTVIYGLGDSYKGNLRRRHLREPTPYNTYTIKGLPPTPIALPGREAIHAALHPKPGASLYFVAKGDGTHYFSSTLVEHNKAVKKYQLQRKSNYRSAPLSMAKEPTLTHTE